MTTFLKAKDLTQEQFLELIGNLQPSDDKQPGYVWLEAPDGWAFDCWGWRPSFEGELGWRGAGREPIKESSQDCLAKSTAGRLFAPEGELRWRTIPVLGESCWRTVFLGNDDWVGTALNDHSDCLSGLQPHNDNFFLWGQQTPSTLGEWVELRIPHRFHYPVPGNPNRVKILVEQWSDDTGTPHFFRLCDLKPH